MFPNNYLSLSKCYSPCKEHSSIRIPGYSLTMFSPSDLSQDSKRARLRCACPRTPVFSILNQSLLAGIAMGGYVIKLCVTVHNVFSRWPRIRKEKRIKQFLIILRVNSPCQSIYNVYV